MSDTTRMDLSELSCDHLDDQEWGAAGWGHARQLERELAEITEQLDEVVDENHLLKFQLKTEKHLNEDHEKDYLAIWKLIKKPNETVVDAAKRIKLNLAEVTKQRDAAVEGLEKIASLDFVITLPDRMDAVRNIANETLNKLKP